ncbi:DNA-primase RepB domain-containing protein [Falsiroseomonas sp. CW058]|uniref:DNA-primase RepB domain-containing protein n=1 Tax=Falsiroseomonas sp. CW058 TaxID=3388664 RepID=UPI003D31188A
MHIFVPGGRTHDAISQQTLRRWLEALPAPSYLVVLRQEESGRVLRRVWSPDVIVQATAWMRHMNAAGWSILGRPWCGGRHVLVDDLATVTLARLADAYAPSAVVESSPGSFQAWVTVSQQPVGAELAGAVARLLARRFGGDIGATAWSQPGRVPAYTSRKPGRRMADGRYPYVRLVSADGPTVTPGADALLAEARGGEGGAPPVAAPPPPPPSTPPTSGGPRLIPRLPAEEVAEATRRLREMLPVGTPVDRSRRDYSIAYRLARHGASPAHIADVLAASDKVERRPAGAVDAYIDRTVRAAMDAVARRQHGGRS